MKIVFSDHARKQNLIRKIPKKNILETIKNPEENLKSFRNRRLLRKAFGGKILEVVATLDEKILVVITQYWLEE